MISKEEKEEIEKKLREMPSTALIQTINEMLEEEETEAEVLKIFLKEMKKRKFNSPFGFLVNITRGESEEDSDRAKQTAYFRRLATLKKYAYYSTLIAIAARRIKRTVENNRYFDFVPFLPINGNYLYNIMHYGYFGLISYRTIYDSLKESGDKEEAFLYEIEGENYFYRKKLRKEKDIEEHLQEGEKVKGKRKSSITNSIIRSISIRKALCSSITGYSGFLSFGNAEKKFKSLKDYNEVLKRRGYVAFYNIENYLKVDKGLKEDLEKIGAVEGENLKEEVKKEIIKAREFISIEMLKLAKLMLAVPLAKHYLLKSEVKRKLNPLYPSLSVNPSKNQLKVLSIANEYIGFPLEKVVEEKLEKESLMDSRVVSLAIIGEKYGIEKAEKFFKAKKEEIINAINLMKKPKMGRGRDFLEKLKD